MWQIKRDGTVIAWGESDKGKPSPEEARRFRADGYKVFVDAKEVEK